MDIAAAGQDVQNPTAWCSASLQDSWTSGDAEAIIREPCVIFGEAEGYAHMLICDTCNRPSHLQCLNPPRSVVPDGPWYCHMCDGAYTNVEEFRRDGDAILFARGSDPYHPVNSQLLESYVRLQEAGLLKYRNSLSSVEVYSLEEASAWATGNAETVFSDITPKQVRRRVRNKAKALRLHPTLVGWYLNFALVTRRG